MERTMSYRLDLESLGKEVLAVLQKYGLQLEYLGINIAMSGKNFDAIADGHPDLVNAEMMRKSVESDGVQWWVQIMRIRALEDFPPGAILSPPPDDAVRSS
jgi:hypothetical protein